MTWNEFFADIDADDGDLIGGRVGHGRAPSNAAPIQLCSPVGREHGRTIRLVALTRALEERRFERQRVP